jgi:zinc transport system ATP-binding protein
VLVVGGTGSGKTSLLRAAAGLDSDKGELLWDGTPVSTQALARSGHVSFVAQNPVFRRTSLASLLGLPRDGDLEAVGDVLRACSIRKLVGRAPRGLATKVSSATLTVTEARGLSLCRLLIGGAGSVWIIDDPFAGSGRSRCEERLKAILDRAAERTVVISTRRPVSIESFDRVVVLKSGRVRFSGTPADFAALGRSQHHRDELRAAV